MNGNHRIELNEPQAAPLQRGVPANFQELMTRIDNLNGAFKELRALLAPVLVPEGPGEPAKAEVQKRPSSSEVANGLLTLIRNVESISMSVEDVLRRLDV